MASIWRPFAEEEEPEVIDVIAEGPTEEARSRMKIKVGERERELILNVYLHCGNKGWNAVLRKVREDIKQEPLNARLVDYYIEATDTTVIKRMQRIDYFTVVVLVSWLLVEARLEVILMIQTLERTPQ